MLQKPSKFLRALALGAGTYSAAAAGMMAWPASGYLAAGLAGMYLMRAGKRQLSAMGTARWADQSDLKRAGMLNGDSGLILGRMGKEIVRFPQSIHTLVCAPPGSGKFVSIVAPELLTNRGSCVLLDPKGEGAKLSASFREREFGHHVVLIDPYKIITSTPDTFNPVQHIDAHSPYALDDANDLAASMIVRTGEEKEPHWSDGAEMFSAGAIGTVVACGDRESRNLAFAQNILSFPANLDLAIKLMKEKIDIWGGALARIGGQLEHFVDKERNSVLTSALRHWRFINTPAIAESVTTSSFDPAKLRQGKMTIYLILPPDRMPALAGLTRMWIGSLIRACVRGGLE